MKARPILLRAHEVRGILDGRQTQVRRIIDSRLIGESHWKPVETVFWYHEDDSIPIAKATPYCPFGKPGDRLWVRETLRKYPERNGWGYDADKSLLVLTEQSAHEGIAWAHHQERDVCVSIHMPRWASRITLEIVGVRVERLQSISEEDARAEDAEAVNITDPGDTAETYSHLVGFRRLWTSIHGPGSWEANPWVWVLSFRRVVCEK